MIMAKTDRWKNTEEREDASCLSQRVEAQLKLLSGQFKELVHSSMLHQNAVHFANGFDWLPYRFNGCG